MYNPPHFRETDRDRLHAFIRAHPLGLLISSGEQGPLADPVPFLLDPAAGPLGTLRAHLARANPQLAVLRSAPEVLVVFQGADSYVTPSWYETKRRSGKVVPTWNYAMVQARGPVRLIEDRRWLLDQVGALTREHERHRPIPWAVTDAPPAFVDSQLAGIVGIEIEIRVLEGKWKVSQNRPPEDRRGVAAGLEAEGSQAARQVAAWVRERGGFAPPAEPESDGEDN